MREKLTIEKFMTPMPLLGEEGMPVRRALELMKQYGIRHLPVGGRKSLAGIVSVRDLEVGAAFPGPGELNLGDVMSKDVYRVGPNASLESVVRELAGRKCGCAVVCQNDGNVVGIFTDTDALTRFSHLLETLLHFEVSLPALMDK